MNGLPRMQHCCSLLDLIPEAAETQNKMMRAGAHFNEVLIPKVQCYLCSPVLLDACTRVRSRRICLRISRRSLRWHITSSYCTLRLQ